MESLIQNNYQNIGLFCGPSKFSSENDCIQAYKNHIQQSTLPISEQIITTDFSKEDAFRKAFIGLNDIPFQAIICSTESIANGVSSAASLLNISLKDELTLLVLARENWCLSPDSHGIIYSSKSAYKMGIKAGNLLLEAIKHAHSVQHTHTSLVLTDSVVQSPSHLTVHPAPLIQLKDTCSRPQKLRIMITDLNSSNSIMILSKQFERIENVEIEFKVIAQKDVLNSIVRDNQLKVPFFDLYMYDIPWLPYLAQNQLIDDITDYVKTSPYHEENFFSHNLKNCLHEGHCYGIPVVGGAQIMFYRKDLFEDPVLNQKYESLYGCPPHSSSGLGRL